MGKRGKNRKKYKTDNSANEPPKASYVRNGSKPIKDVRDQKWSTSLKKILQMTTFALITSLLVTGHLPDVNGDACEVCGNGQYQLQKLQTSYMWRCDDHDCQHRVGLLRDHPIFDGKSGTTLQTQTAALFCYLQDISQISCQRLLDVGKVFVRSMYQRIEHFLHDKAIEAQSKVIFGAPSSLKKRMWDDVECDEVQLRRKQIKVQGSNRDRMSWPGNWWGSIQRGIRKTLVLEELPARTTTLRAPGPGPITKAEWLRLGNKWFKNKHIIVHTDSAKAYMTKITGTRHDYIVHSKKKLLNGLRSNTVFAENVRHVLPNHKHLWVRSGTQHIDGFWRVLRRSIKFTTRAINRLLRTKVRAAQWRYVHGGQDLWMAIGQELYNSW